MLSVIIITKNEEDVIADCIDSVRNIADEIIVVDSESSDNTCVLAKRAGAKVLVHGFEDFSKQRNFAFEHTKEKWILYLDADERATSEFKRELELKIKSFSEDSGIGGFFIRRKTYYFGKDWDYIDKVQRVFYKDKFKKWTGIVHETAIIEGRFGLIQSPILHYTHRNLEQMLAKTNEWSEYEAELRFKAKHPEMNALRFVRVMVTVFFQSYIIQKGYKNGTEGLIEAIYQMYSMFITYSKLWEKQNADS